VEDAAEELRPAKAQQNEPMDGKRFYWWRTRNPSGTRAPNPGLARYKVLEAEDGEAGLRIAGACQEHIDILITDVVMPGMGGRELAKKLVALRPGMACSFFGYTEDAVIAQGAPGPASAFLQKPLLCRILRGSPGSAAGATGCGPSSEIRRAVGLEIGSPVA